MLDIPVAYPPLYSYTVSVVSPASVDVYPSTVSFDTQNIRSFFTNIHDINPIASIPFITSSIFHSKSSIMFENTTLEVQIDIKSVGSIPPAGIAGRQLRRSRIAAEASQFTDTLYFSLPAFVIPAVVPLADDVVLESLGLFRSFWSTETLAQPTESWNDEFAMAAWIRDISRPAPMSTQDSLSIILDRDMNMTFVIHSDARRTAYTRMFPDGTRITANGHPCKINWIVNGTMMHITVPPASDVCEKQVRCNVTLEIDTGVDNLAVISSLSINSDSAIASSISNTLGMRLYCPPYCPGRPHLPILRSAGELILDGLSYDKQMTGICFSPPTLFRFAQYQNTSTFMTAVHAQTCDSLPGYVDATRFPDVCLNGTDPRSRRCPFGIGESCGLCPDGVFCLGGYHVIPMEGHWIASTGSSPNLRVVKCAYPSSDRCPGFNMSRGIFSQTKQECGLAYDGFACSFCSKGYYVISDLAVGVCARCPNSNVFREIFVPMLIMVGALAGLAVIIGLATILITRRYGGTVSGALKRAFTFVLASLGILQLAAQANETLRKLPNLSPAVSAVTNAASVFNFAVGKTPAGCFSSDPFTTEVAVLSAFIALCMSLIPLYFSASSFSTGQSVSGVINRLRPCSKPSMWPLMRRVPHFARKIIVMILFAGYGPVSNIVFKTFSCETKSITIQGYLQMQHDGATLTRLGYGEFRSMNLSTSTYADEVLTQPIPVRVSKSHPSAVCMESSHKRAFILSITVFLLYIIVTPLSLGIYSTSKVRQRRQAIKQLQGIRDSLLAKHMGGYTRDCRSHLRHLRAANMIDMDEALSQDTKVSPIVDSVYR
jgi:hypothetical protein